jgi:hypothetical protein
MIIEIYYEILKPRPNCSELFAIASMGSIAFNPKSKTCSDRWRIYPFIQNLVMRYSIMLQLVAIITLIFLSTAALFAWLQYRPGSKEQSLQMIRNELI